MRLRILKNAYTTFGLINAGEVRDISDPPASDWLKSGLAMQDKSQDGATETKTQALPVKTNKTKRKSRRVKL